MKRLYIGIIAVMTVASCAKQTNPFFEEWTANYGLPPFDRIKVEDYMPAIQEGIKEQKAEIEAIKSNKEAPTFANVVEAYEYSGSLLSKVEGVLFNLAETDADDAMNKVVDEATEILTVHSDDIFMDKAFFAKVKAVHDAGTDGLDREQQMVLKNLYEAFVRNGIDLPEADQAVLKEINRKLSVAGNTFGNRLLAENNAFKAQFDVPVSQYSAEMTVCEDRARREAMFKAYSSRGRNGGENDTRELCLEILRLRAEKARMLGFNNWAEYQLDNKMAHDPGTVDAFLKEIQDASNARAKEEIADMQKLMDADIKAGKLPAGSRIMPWDWFYYAEKVRKQKYDLDESVTSPYFLCDNVRQGVFAAASRLYGIEFEELTGVPVYNPEVRAFKLTDKQSGDLIGIFLADYFPRSTKRGGAWMNNVRDQYVDPSGKDVRPIIVNVCNFTPAKGDTPSLLTVDEVQTMFHEFGHALHGFLSKCRYPSVSGTGVTRDFVETFSQFNENWAFQKEILEVYAKNYKTGEVIPEALVEKINNSLKFNQGFMTGELCAASILDMRWHELSVDDLKDIDIDSFEEKVCKEMELPKEIIPRYRTTYFNHIFNSGYSAGYYGYLWTEVLDKDAFSYFEREGIFNPDVALRFKKTFLEKGGSEEPMVLFRQFTGGNDPDTKAMLRGRGLID